MITYRVAPSSGGYIVVVKESGVVVAGPFAHKGMALAEANLRASQSPGNRVES